MMSSDEDRMVAAWQLTMDYRLEQISNEMISR
jgi:hypothetical protein